MSDMDTMTETAVPTWTLGDRLRKARDWAGIKQGEMAERLDKSRAAISGWEGDQHRPDTLALRAWAKETGTPEWWLEGFESEDAAVRSKCFWEPTLPFDEPAVWTKRQGTPHNFLTIPELAGHPSFDNDASDAGTGGQWMTSRRVDGYTSSDGATSHPAPSTSAPALLAA